MASLNELVRYCDQELRTSEVPDYDAALNGLQLANNGTVTRIAAAVDFSSMSVQAAARQRADMLVVHHGMFWRGMRPIIGPSYDRLRAAMDANLAIYSSHIPLDVHPTLGNNALLARELALESAGTFGRYRSIEIGVCGTASIRTTDLFERVRSLSAAHATSAVCTPCDAQRITSNWAIITGVGASGDTLAEASERGVDTLIVGEGTHHTAVDAMERGVVVMYGGHYATETLGVKALAAALGDRFGVPWEFLDIPTGL